MGGLGNHPLLFQTVDGFRSRLKALLRSQPKYAAGLDKGIMPEGYLEAPLAYDAIWAIAFGELFVG